MSPTPHRIDVHHHIFPPVYVKALQKQKVADAGGVAIPDWSVESALALMDRHAIATAITSVAAPGVYFGDAAEARDLARRCNEYSARLVQEYPERFGAFAVLPLPDVDGALKELEYALDVLHLDGATLLSSIGDRYLGDPAFDDLFTELDRRKSVVFMHPTVPPSSRDIKLALPGALIEFVFDTTRAVTNLIYSGTLERCRNLSIILPHAGGTVPYLAGRIALFGKDPHLNAKAPQGAMAYLRRFYYETALTTAATALSSLRELADPSRILFGSDNPFAPEWLIQEKIQELQDFTPFDAPARAAIERSNAFALFPRLRKA
jgi:predicted TIM-barrel fold metal-dependent hydrolase